MTVQDLSFLLSEGPAELLERTPEEYAALLRTAGELRPRELAAVDYALRHSVVRLLTRAAGDEELAGAYDALRRMVPVSRETDLAGWIPRWRAFADLLDSRRAVLASRDPAAAHRLAHAGVILSLVEEAPGLTQTEIGVRLKLRPANLSRILGVLEAHELIERRSVGREKRIHAGRLFAGGGEPPVSLPAGGTEDLEGEAVAAGAFYLYKHKREAA